MFRKRVYIKRFVASAILIGGILIAALSYQDGFDNKIVNEVVSFSLSDISLPDIKVFKFSFSDISLPDISLGTVLSVISAPFTREEVGAREEPGTEEGHFGVYVDSVSNSEIDISLSSDLLDASVSLNTAEGKKQLISKIAYYVGAYFDFFKELLPEEAGSLDKVKWYFDKLRDSN